MDGAGQAVIRRKLHKDPSGVSKTWDSPLAGFGLISLVDA